MTEVLQRVPVRPLQKGVLVPFSGKRELKQARSSGSRDYEDAVALQVLLKMDLISIEAMKAEVERLPTALQVQALRKLDEYASELVESMSG